MAETLPLLAIATHLSPAPAVPEPINIDQAEAARLTGVSAKTLERLAKSGEPVGRFRVGNRVLFHLSTLRTWIANRVSINPPNLS